jgi:hypothetical protein
MIKNPPAVTRSVSFKGSKHYSLRPDVGPLQQCPALYSMSEITYSFFTYNDALFLFRLQVGKQLPVGLTPLRKKATVNVINPLRSTGPFAMNLKQS